MRFLPLAPLLLAACSPSANPGDALVGAYRGQGRDALCIAREGEALKAGFIIYGGGATNCSFAGRAEIRGGAVVVTPRGESECSVDIGIANGVAKFGGRTPSCEYYCGPGADYSGRALQRAPDPSRSVADFGGDPLC
jgi:hypothetical protein